MQRDNINVKIETLVSQHKEAISYISDAYFDSSTRVCT